MSQSCSGFTPCTYDVGIQALQQWLRHNRIEERRSSYRTAAAKLADAKMKWDALPMEKRAAQENIDGLVRRVEHALMSILPPLPAQVNAPSLENDKLLQGPGRKLAASTTVD